MKKLVCYGCLMAIMLFSVVSVQGQRRKNDPPTTTNSSEGLMNANTFSDVKFRSIGPAFMGGRIADIAIHPNDESTWYVAVGSGGVWKTENAGITWKSIFDDQSVYSTGCITIDPQNPHVIWLGTGENVGGRHVGFGDGIYKSEDDGATWTNMGLKASQHISKIIIHPENSQVMWVAVQGPLWNKGGERGLYKSVDGGNNWKKTLGDDQWTGVTDLVIDPRNPDLLYAATWQRHRTVAAYMGGGPGSGLHKSTDGGETWEKLAKGLPESNMGKIGLAISPQKPDILYAAIELDTRTGGVFKSENRGASWAKMSNTVSGATGPHYYQELYASPHQFDKLYLMDVRIQVSENGGKNFRQMNEEYKHSDNHAIAFKMSDPDYVLIGTDGGIYESFDGEKNWRFINNFPIAQYYKVAVDDAAPFYNIYGGTQDTNTHGGPSRTDNMSGITNGDWYITVFADGHQPATEPGNPDIVYSEWQQGNLVRTDRTTGEIVYIQPQPEEGEDYERFNWDAPILVSPHDPKRLYFASQRVWRSDNRGDSWKTISKDLTRDQERLALPIMGGTQSFENPWDVLAMSNYNTITSLAESPKKEGLLYAGTDDGLIQVTEDGGSNWRKMEVGSIPGIPSTAFINDIKADLFNENVVYVALDNHKYGDFKPYLVKSTDKGRTWKSIATSLPEKTMVWRIVQDHVKPGLMFLATEFGIYFTVNGGSKWTQLKGGLPTISFRDLAIQRRENDLVGASFGRSFYVLDDYSFLRDVSETSLDKEGMLFPARKALWYIPRPVVGYSEKGNMGAGYYTAKNPDFGATFTYHLKESLLSNKEKRKETEKERVKANQNVAFAGWDKLTDEANQLTPKVWLTIKNSNGRVIRKLECSVKEGMHRISWDLRYAPNNVISPNNVPKEANVSGGVMAGPGNYTAVLSKSVDGVTTQLGDPVPFEVVPMTKGVLPSQSPAEVAEFWQSINDLQNNTAALNVELVNSDKRLKAMMVALDRSTTDSPDLMKQLVDIQKEINSLKEQVFGNELKQQVGEKTPPGISSRLGTAVNGTFFSTYGPTPTHKRSMEIASKEFADVLSRFSKIRGEKIPALESALRKSGAPWIEGQSIPIK